MSSLVVERVESQGSLAALGPAWSALEASSGNALPFRTFSWVDCWWKHFREGRAAVTDTLAIRAVRTPAGRLVGVAPLILTQRPAVGPVQLRCLQLVGADPNVTEVRGALCEPFFARECHEAVQADIMRAGWRGVDWVRWSGLRDDACLALRDERTRWSEGPACYVLELPATWEELYASRPRNLKESLRKCYNSLRRDGLHCELEVVDTKAPVAAALDDFFRLHAARAGMSETVRHPNVFAHPRCRAFLVEVCARFAERDMLRIFRLHVGRALVATRIGFALGETIYLYYSGFDPEYARYGVMTTTLAEALKYAIARGHRRANLSTGRDTSKLRWRPEEVVYRDATITPAGAIAQMKYEAAIFAQRAIRKARINPFFARRAPIEADPAVTPPDRRRRNRRLSVESPLELEGSPRRAECGSTPRLRQEGAGRAALRPEVRENGRFERSAVLLQRKRDMSPGRASTERDYATAVVLAERGRRRNAHAE